MNIKQYQYVAKKQRKAFQTKAQPVSQKTKSSPAQSAWTKPVNLNSLSQRTGYDATTMLLNDIHYDIRTARPLLQEGQKIDPSQLLEQLTELSRIVNTFIYKLCARKHLPQVNTIFVKKNSTQKQLLSAPNALKSVEVLPLAQTPELLMPQQSKKHPKSKKSTLQQRKLLALVASSATQYPSEKKEDIAPDNFQDIPADNTSQDEPANDNLRIHDYHLEDTPAQNTTRIENYHAVETGNENRSQIQPLKSSHSKQTTSVLTDSSPIQKKSERTKMPEVVPPHSEKQFQQDTAELQKMDTQVPDEVKKILAMDAMAQNKFKLKQQSEQQTKIQLEALSYSLDILRQNLISKYKASACSFTEYFNAMVAAFKPTNVSVFKTTLNTQLDYYFKMRRELAYITNPIFIAKTSQEFTPVVNRCLQFRPDLVREVLTPVESADFRHTAVYLLDQLNIITSLDQKFKFYTLFGTKKAAYVDAIALFHD